MARIFDVQRVANKIILGTTGTIINIASHTASTILGLDASKDLESLAIPLIVANGGTGLATITDHGILLGSGTGAITPLGVAANGKIPIGSVGADPVLAEITGTTNQIISTPGAGTITLSLPQNIHTGATDFEVAGLKVVNKITEFSTDGTMGGDSDSAVPTEKATKLYTDTLRSDLASTSNAKGASLVGVEDSATQFDATDVEAALSELIVLVTPVEYNPVMSRTAGGDAGGNDASVATIDDADSYDTDEISATPGFDIQAVFTGVTDFNQVQIHTAYDGNPAHVVRIDLDKTPFNWSSFTTILADIDDSSGDFVFKAITVASAAQYINSGEVRLRFYHSSAGNATHDFFIDYCALWKTGTSVGVTEHGGLTGLLDDDHTQYIKDVEFTQDSGILVGTGAGTFAEETGATLRTSIGVGTGDNPIFSGVVLSDDLVFSAEKLIRTNTSDASDDSSITMCGGGAASNTRGAYINLYGNEHGSNGGINIIGGNNNSAQIALGCFGSTQLTITRLASVQYAIRLETGTTLFITEKAAANTDISGFGQVWVKTGVPCTLAFTDEGGADFDVGVSDGTTGGSGSAGAGNQYIELNIGGTTYKVLHDGTV
jgi:hypothetical protein